MLSVLNILLLGDRGVGKTRFVMRFVSGTFADGKCVVIVCACARVCDHE